MATQGSFTSAGTSHLWRCTVSSLERASRLWDRPGPPGLWRLLDRSRNDCWPSVRRRSFSSPGCWPGGRTRTSKPPSAAGLARSDQGWSWTRQNMLLICIWKIHYYKKQIIFLETNAIHATDEANKNDILLLQSQGKYPSSQWGRCRRASVRLCAFVVQIRTSLQEIILKNELIAYGQRVYFELVLISIYTMRTCQGFIYQTKS